MTEIVLFHSAMGLRPGVLAFADELRADGHLVHVPDLYDGHVFDDRLDGIAYRDQTGIPKLTERATESVADLPAELVYAGFSLGAAPAQLFAQTRAGARGALLLHGCLPSAAFGRPWPSGVPLAVHTTESDPFVDQDVAEALVAEASGELYRYLGAAHLFFEPGLSDYQPAAATLATERILDFLRRVDTRG
jgi:dienelactone hydrolase